MTEFAGYAKIFSYPPPFSKNRVCGHYIGDVCGSANDIWDMLDEREDTEGIVGALLAMYEVEADECRRGVLKFLSDLAEIGYVSLEKRV